MNNASSFHKCVCVCVTLFFLLLESRFTMVPVALGGVGDLGCWSDYERVRLCVCVCVCVCVGVLPKSCQRAEVLTQRCMYEGQLYDCTLSVYTRACVCVC